MNRKLFEFKVLNPYSSESRMPFFVIDSRVKFGFYFQRNPFGLYIRIPLAFVRWGCA